MRIQPETLGGTAHERALITAFGLPLELDPGIDIPGIAALDDHAARDPDARPAAGPLASPPGSRQPTRVSLDPGELARRWSGAEHAAERVRELREEDVTLLTVDYAPPAGYLLHAPGFGRILSSPDGTELICDPEAGNPEWTALLTAQALPLAATLRGLEVLHASGVALRGRAALFTGPTGAGKSSLAAALLRRGATLLSDDTVTLELRDASLLAHPGVGLLQLLADEHERLSARERAVLGPADAFMDKQRYTPTMATSTVPFGELFLLERSSDGPIVERIETVDPFALLAGTFNLSVRTPERLVRHLDLAVALAATERIYRLRVQPGMNATELAEIVHARLLEL
jgi:hypothetical protein